MQLSLPPSFSLTGEEGRVRTPTSPVRERENCPELLFLFLKGMTGALAPFSYLVFKLITSAIISPPINLNVNFPFQTLQPIMGLLQEASSHRCHLYETLLRQLTTV
jgi:hypothetical protein